MKIILTEKQIKNILIENYQLAQKKYFNTNLLSNDIENIITDVFGKNNPYYILGAEIIKYFNINDKNTIYRILKPFKQNIEEYNKNLFPLKYNLLDYNHDTNDIEKHTSELYSLLDERKQTILQYEKLPSIAKRNLKDIRSKTYVSPYEFKKLTEKLKDINGNLKFLSDINKLDIYLTKIFNSQNTLKDSYDILNKIVENHSFSSDITIEKLNEFIEDNKYTKKVYDKNNIIILNIENHKELIELTCNSLWCFSRPNSDGYWDDYAPFGFVYVIFNFNVEYDSNLFMCVLLPHGMGLYDTNNKLIDEGKYLKKYNIEYNFK